MLGHDEDAASYASLYGQIKNAFANRWVRADGTVGSGSQTSYVLALKFGLVPDTVKQAAFDRLVDDVQGRGNHLSTGFLGTPFLLNVLQDGGRADVAYKLLTQDTYPSWGYMLARGGTTIWERWDGIRPDGSLQDAGMNSFNHYGLGSIGDWLYDEVGGLAPAEPGYRKLRVQPATGAELSSASSAVKTSYGQAKTAWSRDDAGRLRIDVDVPVNARAEVHIPVRDGQQALEGGKPAAEQPGVTYKGTDERRRGLRGRLGQLPLPGRGGRRGQRERRRVGDRAGHARAQPRRPGAARRAPARRRARLHGQPRPEP